jgi:hypothetical protein
LLRSRDGPENETAAGEKYAKEILGAYAHAIDKRVSIVTVNAFQLHAKNFLGERGE